MSEITEYEMDKLVEKRLMSMMEENSPKLLSFFVLQVGRKAFDANAGTLILSSEVTFNGKRYKINNETTVTQLENSKP